MNEQFRLENESNLIHEFLYQNFNKKVLLNFLVKCHTETHELNFMHFENEMVHLFFLQKKVLTTTSVNDTGNTNNKMVQILNALFCFCFE